MMIYQDISSFIGIYYDIVYLGIVLGPCPICSGTKKMQACSRVYACHIIISRDDITYMNSVS
jgi:uncharacterized membrane protein